MNIKGYEDAFHPFANVFPLIDQDTAEAKEMREDIQRHGIREKIKLYQGKVLDGRNRVIIADMLGMDWRRRAETLTFPNDTAALDYVQSANLHRRHLDSPSVRAIIVAEFVSLYEEAAQTETKKRQQEAAEKTNRQLGRGQHEAAKDEAASREPTSSNLQVLGSKDEEKTVLCKSTPDRLSGASDTEKTTGEMLRAEAEKAGISTEQAKRGRRVLKKSPATAQKVKEGKQSLNAAYQQITAQANGAQPAPATGTTAGLDEAHVFLESLPLYPILKAAGHKGVVFQHEALAWRELEKARNAFKSNVDKVFKEAKPGPLQARDRRSAGTPHPKFWKLCPQCKGAAWHRVTATGGHVAPGEAGYEEAQTVKCACKVGYTLD